LFYNAHGVAGSDFYFHGEVVERESEDVYIIHRGAFTSCAQPTPRWHFTAGKARIRRDHHARLHNAFLKIKSVPVFYVPILYYPINEDNRSTGFLMPNIGNSSYKGFLISQGFFWAINRSMDATITGDWFSEAGIGLGTEYRYVASPSSRGDFMSYFLSDKISGQREYTLNYSMNQDVPGGFRAIARVDYFSSFDFQQRFQESYNSATQRSKRASVTISNSWSQFNLRATFDRNDTSFNDRIAIRQILPSITLNTRPTNLGPTPLLYWFGTEISDFSRTTGSTEANYKRFDIVPSISYPFTKLSYLTFRTTLTARYSYYTAQAAGPSIIDEPIDRRYAELKFDARGPTFARIFNTPGNFYADRYKHVIEPQVVWSYRTRVDTFKQIPKFDSKDYIPGTNQVSFQLVNRFFSKKAPPGAEEDPAVPGTGAAVPTEGGSGEAAPAEGEAAPAEGEAAPAEGEAAPAEGEAAPVEGGAAPAEGEAAEGEAAPAEGETAPSEGETAPAEGETAPAEGETAPAQAPGVPAPSPGTAIPAPATTATSLVPGTPGVAPAAAPVEFLTWVLAQRYFFDINASLYDSQFSTPYFSEDGVPSSYSPITSKLTFRPNPRIFVSWNLEYDVNFSEMRSTGLMGTFAAKWGSLRGMWSRVNLLNRNQVRNNLRLLNDLRLGARWMTNFEINYDIEQKQMTLIRGGVNYNIQCCGFLFEVSRYRFGRFRNENLFRFAVTLANVGSFGTFLGGQSQN
jgi:lipopolysaccharide assembly outer membrane protein LptD (OstA)